MLKPNIPIIIIKINNDTVIIRSSHVRAFN